MDNCEQFDLFREQLSTLLEIARKSGLNSWEILGEVIKVSCDLYVRAGMEYRIKGGQ